jgi:hypothetical protein
MSSEVELEQLSGDMDADHERRVMKDLKRQYPQMNTQQLKVLMQVGACGHLCNPPLM